jgi:hypothetical protein
MAEELSKVAKITAYYLEMSNRFANFRAAQKKAYDYVIGEQITDDMRTKLRKEKRPALVYNLMQPLLLYIAGILYTNKTRLRALPKGEGDEELADMHSRLVSDYAIGKEGYYEIAKAAVDAAVAKVGWVNQHWSMRTNPEGDWVCESFDPLMVLFDVDARKKDHSDWRHMSVSAFYSAEEIVNMYRRHLTPEMIEKIIEEAEHLEGEVRGRAGVIGWLNRVFQTGADVFRGRTRRYTEGGYISDLMDARHGLYRVIEFHDRRQRDRRQIYSPFNRQSEEIPQEKIRDEGYAVDRMGATSPETGEALYPGAQIIDSSDDEMWITVVVPGLIQEKPILEKPYEIQGKGFQLKPIFAYDFHPDLTKTASICDALIDPQDSYNQRRMSMLEWLMDAINPDYLVPDGAIDQQNEAEWRSKERGLLKTYAPVAGLKPEKEHPMAEAYQLQTFAAEDRDMMQTISGVSPNQQGFKETTKESGVLYQQRVQQGLVMLGFFLSNVERGMVQIFNYCDRGLQKFMTLPRKVRLLADQTATAEWMQINMPTLMGVHNDVSQGEYDFVADPTQIGPTMKQVKLVEAIEFIKMMPVELVYWPEIFELWDSPVSARMKAYAEYQMGMMQQQQQEAGAVEGVQQGLGIAQMLTQMAQPPQLEAAAGSSGGNGGGKKKPAKKKEK